ncbi:MAG: hypothetical protein RL213_803 [Bacteroidota bacterium]|jgi:hypothetical protein
MPRFTLPLICLLLLLLFRQAADGQPLSNQRRIRTVLHSDTLRLDSLSLVPGSVILLDRNGNQIDSTAFREDWANGCIIVRPGDQRLRDTVTIRYRVLSVRLGETVRHKDPLKWTLKGEPPPNPFLYRPADAGPFSLFPDKGVQANGSIARGVSFGNNQDVFVNSSMNLQLAGKLNEDIDLTASISDENIPVQPEGNTQQLQEFDRVFIRLAKDRTQLIAGDFELRRPDSYFMNFFKRGQGALFSTSVPVGDTLQPSRTRRVNATASVAVAKGRFSRMVFQGTEGNQGPYRLSGGAGEVFIIVLSGTEKVFLDGQLMIRGMQNDYVIDYNTAEVTFMPKRLITKDSRIIVEFEYSDRNYVRSMFFLNNEFETEAVKIRFNAYSEQDSRNQPLLQDLDSSRKAVMAAAGDNIGQAYFPTADSLTAFDDTRVLYLRIDSTTASATYPGVFVYSTDSSAARWQVTFTEVGAGAGDYVQDIRSANGRVFRWVEPVGGVSQGNYRPVQLLITPKRRRMVTLGSDIKVTGKSLLSVETAWSENDINLFSAEGKSNDNGTAARIGYRLGTPLSADSANGWKLDAQAGYEFTSKYFNPLEPFRPAEFNRDWNVSGLTDTSDQQLISADAAFSRKGTGTAGYRLKSYLRGNAYTGWNHGLFSDLSHKGFSLKGTANKLLSQASSQQTDFLRHQFDFSKSFGRWTAGIRDNTEENLFKVPDTDSLLATSYIWRDWSGYIGYRDSLNNRITLSAKNREDRGVRENRLVKAANAREISGSVELASDTRNTLRITSTYRDLSILDASIITVAPTQTLVNRIEHQANIRKGMLTATTFYEAGSGRDRRQEFYYLEVPAGQGTYAYIGDLNSNGVKDLNEFAAAVFQDQARYIRVFFNSDEYIATRSNSFSEVINLNPAAGRKTPGKARLIDRFSDQLLVRMEKKTKDETILSSLNPFSNRLADSQLVSTGSNLRNTVFFNRTDPVFGADYTWQQSRNKSLLVSGFDYRSLDGHALNIRWNTSREWQWGLVLETQRQLSSSEFFDDRDYELIGSSAEPKITYQPGQRFRALAALRIGTKENIESGTEKVEERKLTLEARMNTADAGMLSARFNYIQFDYTGNVNSFIAYEMLGGLTPGKNLTWNLSLLRNINKVVQLNLNYDGRKGEKSKTVHTGSVQFRAFF